MSAEIRLAKNIKFEESAGGVGQLVDTKSERVYSLNFTGCAIVKSLEEGKDLRETVKAQFEDPDACLESDVDGFIANLLELKLVERH